MTTLHDTHRPASNLQDAARDSHAEAAAALRFWEALEYLTPQAPPDVKVEESVWVVRADAELPWNDPHKQAILTRQHGPDWRFHLFAGIVDGDHYVETARRALGAPDIDNDERPPPSPAACVVVATDGTGRATGQVFVSTLPWALRCVLDGMGHAGPLNFDGFFGMDGLEAQLQGAIDGYMIERRLLAPPRPPGAPALTPEERAAALLPLTMEHMNAIVAIVFDGSGWQPDKQLPWRVRGARAPKEDEKVPPDDPLNSFYAEDLARVAVQHAGGNIGAGLRAYLSGVDSGGRIDLEQDVDELIDGVAPARLPPGCWPARHPLVTAQQFAVNTLMRELADGAGLFAVNGPPGTGKTTMLKDIVAAVVVRRADVLVTFDTAAHAFGATLAIDDYDYKAYQLDQRLRGFGIVVASANNGAVENITKELPAAKEIDAGVTLDYFSVVADSIAAGPNATHRAERRERWGLIAAVLGSKTRRREFAQPFWFAGMIKSKTAKEKALAADPLRLRSLPSLFKNVNAGDEWRPDHGALSWAAARERYREARRRVDALTEQAEAAAVAARLLPRAEQAQREAVRAGAALRTELANLALRNAAQRKQTSAASADVARITRRLACAQQCAAALAAVDAAVKELAQAKQLCPDGALATAVAQRDAEASRLQTLREEHDRHLRHPPGFLAQLFRTQRSRRWNERDAAFEEELRQAADRCKRSVAALATLQATTGLIRRIEDKLAGLTAAMAQADSGAAQAGVTDADTPAALERELADCRAAVQRAQAAGAAIERDIATTEARAQALEQQAIAAAARATAAREALAASNLPQHVLAAWDLAALDRATRHKAAPYHDRKLFEARRELFVAAMALHQAFVADAWNKLRPSLAAFVNVLTGGIRPENVPGGVAGLWDTFFLVVPVVSTTFASFPRVFAGIDREQLGWLLIDEAGQAAPQQAVGAIWRARRSVIVGDPLQLEPVVGLPPELVEPLLGRTGAERQWVPPATSAQTLADRANRYGTYLTQPGSDTAVWLGAPLVVHRRCLNPMFDIANGIAYDDKMVYGTTGPGLPDTGVESCWIDMPAHDAEGHWSAAQGREAFDVFQRITAGKLRDDEGRPRVYVITPFRRVAQEMRALLYNEHGKEVEGMVGTVHTFQGKEAEHVIFLLGGDPARPGVIASFAGKKPNLVNVAVTRAKRSLYVIGDRDYWTGSADIHGYFGRLGAPLPVRQPDAMAMPLTRQFTL